jgi:putative hemolysin
MELHVLEIIALPLFLLLSAFFSGSETALFALKKSDLHRLSLSRHPAERIVTRLMESPQKVLITILIGNLFVNLAFSALSTKLLLSRWGQYGHFMSIILVTPLILLFCEISPKIMALHSHVAFSKKMARPIYFFHGLFAPIRAMVMAVANSFIKILGFTSADDVMTADELGHAVFLGEKEGVLKKEESLFIKNIIRFSQKTAENIMVPRNTAFFIPHGASIETAVSMFLEEGAVRAPVYRNNLDTIVGMVDSRDLMPYYLGYRRAKNINRFIKNIYFFPASRDLNDLLNDFLEHRIQISIVVDEFGGTAGVVTLNALLAELMGRGFGMLDAHSKPDVRRISDSHLVISGDLQITDFNLYFNENLFSENAETMAGYITEMIGRFPEKGDEIVVKGHVLRVRHIRKNRVLSMDVIEKM